MMDEHERKESMLNSELATCMPMVKLDEGQYLLGCEKRKIQIKGNGCVVRTGGGYMYLEEFLRHYARSESLKLKVYMVKGGKTYKQTVIGIINKHVRTKKVAANFEKNCPDEIND